MESLRPTWAAQWELVSKKNRRTKQSKVCTETAKSEISSARSEHSQEFIWENTLTRTCIWAQKGGGVGCWLKWSEWWHKMDCSGIQMFRETAPGTFLTEAWRSRPQLMQGLSAHQSVDNKWPLSAQSQMGICIINWPSCGHFLAHS